MWKWEENTLLSTQESQVLLVSTPTHNTTFIQISVFGMQQIIAMLIYRVFLLLFGFRERGTDAEGQRKQGTTQAHSKDCACWEG